MVSGDLKPEKARRPLVLLEKQCKETAPAKRTYVPCTPLAAIKAKAPSNDAAASAATFLKELQPKKNHSPQGTVLAHAGDKGTCVEARGGAQIGGGISQ